MMLSIHGHVDPIPNLGQVDTGGQVVYVIEMTKNLAKQGVKVDIYTRWFEGKKEIEEICPGARIIRIPCGPRCFLRKEELYPYLDEFVENLIKFVRDENLDYDIIHSHYWDAGYVALRIKEKLNAIHIHTSHSLGAAKKERVKISDAEKLYQFNVRLKVEKEILSKADVIVSASPIEPRIIEEYYNISREIHIVPPGVDAEFFSPKAKLRKIESLPEKYIFSTGRIEYTKGFDLLIRAFKYVKQEVPDITLILGGGSLKPTELELRIRRELKELIEKLNLVGSVIQTGRIPNELLPIYYANARVVALPSRYDLFGIVALEALACGTPVVVSKYAGVSVYITEDVGYVCDPENPKEFSSKLVDLLTEEDKARQMGLNGRRMIEEKFTWEKLAKKLLLIYTKALREHINS